MNKIKRGDEVVVITGKDKGKNGKVLKRVEDRVFVSGVNMVKRHTKPVPLQNKPGGIIEREAPVHVSNVAIYNAELSKADRVGFRIEDKDGKKVKVRIFKSNSKQIA